MIDSCNHDAEYHCVRCHRCYICHHIRIEDKTGFWWVCPDYIKHKTNCRGEIIEMAPVGKGIINDKKFD
jgi:hypothetical protein